MTTKKFLSCVLLALMLINNAFSDVPSGFKETQLVTDLDPTDIAFAPDGRLFIVEKSGKVKILKNDSLLSTPFLNIAVDNYNERGLQSIAFDPNFSDNHYVYVFYSVQNGNHNRVSRFTANGDQVVSGSETVILELDDLLGAIHNGGQLLFKDGKLFITTGEGGNSSRSQSMSSFLGKVLRINTDGSIPTDNPFYNTATGNYRAIYALGFRNPFKASVQPGTGKIFLNDVGNTTSEEVNLVLAGKNYGWPSIEGKIGSQTPPANYMDPIYAYDHSQGCSNTGGEFYNPQNNQFPSKYIGKYFFQDYCKGYMKVLDPTDGSIIEQFASNLNRPIDVLTGPDGALYYLARGGMGGGSSQDNTSSNSGSLWKIEFTGSGIPAISVQPSNKTVSVGSSVTFSVKASGEMPLNYQWQRDNVDITGATNESYSLNSVALRDNGATFRVKISNLVGSVTSNYAVLTVSANKPPVATILSPSVGALYSAGDTIYFNGIGEDPEEGDLSAVAFTWRIDFHHDAHTHPAMEVTIGIKSGTFVIPTVGETSGNVWYRVYLTVMDKNGFANTVYQDVLPNKSTVTLASVPSGLPLKLDGQTITSPHTYTGVVGIERSIEALNPLVYRGVTYNLTSWSNEHDASFTIRQPKQNATYTATYQIEYRAPENPGGTISGLDYSYYEGSFTNLPTFTSHTAKTKGTADNFTLSVRERNDYFAIKYSGYIDVPSDAVYTFYTSSDDGSQLFIGNTLVVNNDGLHPTQEANGGIALKAGKHELSVTYFERDGGEVLQVSWESEGIVKENIPITALFRKSLLTSKILEAELAQLNGARVGTNHSGYFGTGFVDYINSTQDFIEWVVDIPEKGIYDLEFRYALAYSNRPLSISVNGTNVVSSFSFPATNSWSNWGTVLMNASLNAGINKIRATAIGYSGANVDYLKISSPAGVAFRSSDDQETINLNGEISLFPIPASTTLRIKGHEKSVEFIRMVDVFGKDVPLSFVKMGENELKINTGTLNNGVYLIECLIGEKMVRRSVVIQK